MIKLMATLLTIGTLASAAIPAQATQDNAVIQDSQSTSIVTGNGNRTIQTIDQSVYQQRQGRDLGNSGVVQTADQYSDTYGNINDTQMRTTQTVQQRLQSTIQHPRGRY